MLHAQSYIPKIAPFAGSQNEVGLLAAKIGVEKGLCLSGDVFQARFTREQADVRGAGSCGQLWMEKHREPAGCDNVGLPCEEAWAAGSFFLAFASSSFQGCSLSLGKVGGECWPTICASQGQAAGCVAKGRRGSRLEHAAPPRPCALLRAFLHLLAGSAAAPWPPRWWGGLRAVGACAVPVQHGCVECFPLQAQQSPRAELRCDSTSHVRPAANPDC